MTHPPPALPMRPAEIRIRIAQLPKVQLQAFERIELARPASERRLPLYRRDPAKGPGPTLIVEAFEPEAPRTIDFVMSQFDPALDDDLPELAPASSPTLLALSPPSAPMAAAVPPPAIHFTRAHRGGFPELEIEASFEPAETPGYRWTASIDGGRQRVQAMGHVMPAFGESRSSAIRRSIGEVVDRLNFDL